ncbi:MAG: hypothetical protein P9M06_07610 [Candidatus Saelkia tenebricola]|nr:hypothetical protein [Candidatus Saelkia tenebricola]
MKAKFTSIVIVFAYITLILIATATVPLTFYFDKEGIGLNVVDKYIHYWDFWWAKKSLIDLHKGFYFTEYICYPDGIDIWNGNSGFLLSYFTIPIQIVFNNHNITYNLTILFSLLFSCLGGYLLTSYLFKSKLIGFFTGYMLAFNPLINFHIKHGFLEFVNLGWGFLYILYLCKMFESKTVKYTLLSCFWFIMTAAWCWYVGYILLLFTIVYFVFNLDYKGVLNKPSIFIPKVILWVLIIGSFLFLVYRSIDYSSQEEQISEIDRKFLNNISEINNENVMLEALYSNVKENYYGAWFQIKFESSLDAKSLIHDSKVDWHRPFYFKLWIIPFFLSGIALLRFKNRQVLFYIFCFLFFTSLAFGPCLIIGERLLVKTINIMPYTVCSRFIPGLGRVQFPLRFCIISILSLAMLSGHGMDVIFNKYKLQQRQKVLFTVIVFLLFIFSTQFHFVLPHNPIVVPEVYLKFAQNCADFAIIEVPFTRNSNILDRLPQKSYKYSYYQVIHNKKRLNGHVPAHIVSRNYPPDIENNYLLNILEDLSNEKISVSNCVIDNQKLQQSINILMKYNYKYILVHKKDLPSEENYDEIRLILNQILVNPEEDCSTNDEIIIYEIHNI